MNPASHDAPSLPDDRVGKAASDFSRAARSRRRRRRRLHRLFGALTAVLLLAGQEFLFRGMFPLPEVVGFNRVQTVWLRAWHVHAASGN
jgi:hypothetical protein